MAVDTTGINTHFNTMIGAMKSQIDTLYDNDKMDPEVYAKAIAGVIVSTMQLAAQVVQQKPLADEQNNKIAADEDFVVEQTSSLGSSVTYNNKIKAMETYADMIGTMGAGGLVPSSDMWTSLFDMTSGLNPSGTVSGIVTVTNVNN